jgi:hypothetical protein
MCEEATQEDKWAIAKLRQLLLRIRDEDQGYGTVKVVLQGGSISVVEHVSIFKSNGGS